MRAHALLLAAVPLWAATTGTAAAQRYTPAPVQVAGAFESSCGDAVAGDIRTGVALLFLLEPRESRAAFERAEAASPDCAIASWGVAVSSLELPGARPDSAAEARAARALARARHAATASPRERAYVETAAHLVEPAASPYAARLRAFAQAARDLARAYPADPHPPLLIALGCLARSTAPGDIGQREAATAIVLRLGEDPQDPAAAALLALARDNDEDAPTARAAATVVLRAHPPSPRALQVAARVFHRLGAWNEAASAGEWALRVAGGAGAEWLLADGRWADHPLPWLVEADVAIGRFERARARLAEATAGYDTSAASLDPDVAWRLRAILDISWFRLRWGMVDWPDARPWPDPDLARFQGETPAPPQGDRASESDRALFAECAGVRSLVEGLLAARAAWPRGEPERLAAARDAVTRLDAQAAAFPVPPRYELWATEVKLATSAAFEARDELAIFMAHASGLRQRIAVAAAWAPDVIDADQLSGDAHLQLRDWREALWRYQAVTKRRPLDARAWLGAARAARRLDDPAAATMAKTFVEIWKDADPGRPEIDEAKRVAAGGR